MALCFTIYVIQSSDDALMEKYWCFTGPILNMVHKKGHKVLEQILRYEAKAYEGR